MGYLMLFVCSILQGLTCEIGCFVTLCWLLLPQYFFIAEVLNFDANCFNDVLIHKYALLLFHNGYSISFNSKFSSFSRIPYLNSLVHARIPRLLHEPCNAKRT
jgi:hypothetical protein